VSSFCLLGMATAKLNREKLRKMMSQQDEAPLTLGKKRKTESSSKKVMDERTLPPSPPPVQKPSIPDPVPASSIEVIDVPAEPSSSRSMERVPTLPRDASLASRRAKSVVTKDDIGEYDKVNTDVIKVAGVHSLMKVRSFPFSLLLFRHISLRLTFLSLCLGFDRTHGDRQSLPSMGGSLDEA
jgi:hypothetical protein